MNPLDSSTSSNSSKEENQSFEETIQKSPTPSLIDDQQSLDNLNPLVPVPNDELDILIKMERANKEMETNQRSAQSILLSNNSISSGHTANNNSVSPTISQSLSRRASFTSCEIEDNFSRQDEISWELWNQIINDWPQWRQKPSQLKAYIRKGIPMYLRPLAWQYLCGADQTDAKENFKEYLKKQSACEKIIRRDIDRTYPDHEFFRSSAGQESLFNVMKAYSIHDPEVGYCQGSAFICGLLLIQNIPEEESFAIFVQVMLKYNLREIYKPNMYHLGCCMFQLDCLVQEMLPELHKHFCANSFHTSMYCSSWFLTLFTTSLPLTLVCRIFDIFLNEGIEIIFRVGLAILEWHKDYLLLLDMEGMLKYFQKELPTKHETDHDGFLNKALAIKYNQRKMKKLEKDFSVLKKEEQEEQIEIRRLRAENKLLKQRIENLEKESANLAERLIKGQVVNAQNAELIYVLKNENQKLKDKQNEMTLENETSQSLRRKQLSEQSHNFNEKEILLEKVRRLIEENDLLRETPDHQRLEEELLQVKLREAEAQLAIRDLQKTIHVLNLEYQQFLDNRQAAMFQMQGQSQDSNANKFQNSQAIEEELLKIKMREAETQSEKKSISLKLMQLDTEKQVAYNQIKRQDEEIRSLNHQIKTLKEKELDTKMSLMEFRRQLDDKQAEVTESKMSHKLHEAEDTHLIAELRQKCASLEVQLQELVTTRQLNDNEKQFMLYNTCISSSTDKLVDMTDIQMKLIMMSSNSNLNLKNENEESNTSASLASIPNHQTTIVELNNLKKIIRSHSEDTKKTDQSKLFDESSKNKSIQIIDNEDDLLIENHQIKTNIQSSISNSLS